MFEMDTLILNGSGLTLEALYDVAYRNRPVAIAPEAYERLAKGRQIMSDLSRSGKPRHRVRRLREITNWFDQWLHRCES